MKLTMYGIPNCNNIKKARTWLNEHGISFDFFNYKQQHIDTTTLSQWCQQVGFETLLNQRGTTFRRLDAADKENIDEEKAIGLMQRFPSLIKRPVLQDQTGQIWVGFDEKIYTQSFGKT